MSLSLSKLSTAAISALMATQALALDPVGPTWLEGACPAKGQNKEDLDLYKMAGLWFEYVWEDHVATDMDHYVCSSFIWLDEGDGTFIVYNSFQFPAEQEMWAMEMAEKERKGLPLEEKEEEDEKFEAFKLDELERDSQFIAYKLYWKGKEEGEKQRAQAAFRRSLDDGTDVETVADADWSKHIQVIDTDYHSYAVGLQCEERTDEASG